MLKLLLSRLATAIPSIIGVIVVTFMLTRMLPGDPAAYFAGLAASPQAIAPEPAIPSRSSKAKLLLGAQTRRPFGPNRRGTVVLSFDLPRRRRQGRPGPRLGQGAARCRLKAVR